MKLKAFSLSILTVMLCLSRSAHAQQAPIPDVITQFWSKLAKAKSVTFRAQVWTWEENPDLVSKPYFHVINTFEVSIQKPNRIVLRGTPPLEYELKDEERFPARIGFVSIGDNALVSDGKRSLLLNTSLRTYKFAPPLKSLTQPGKDLLATLRFDYLFDTEPMKGLVLDSPIRVHSLVQYVLRDPKNPNAEERYLFDADTGAFHSLSYWDKNEKGKMQESERFVFTYWVFNPLLSRDTFDTRPPSGYRTSAELDKEIKARRPNGK